MRNQRVSWLRVALLDDHALVREALVARFSLEPHLKIKGVYSSSQALLAGGVCHSLDVLILDYRLEPGELDGAALIDVLHRRYPRMRIVVFSGHERPAIINMCLRAGAAGFIGKSCTVDHLIRAMNEVAMGRIYLAPPVVKCVGALPSLAAGDSLDPKKIMMNNADLTCREREVLQCRISGMSVGEIAVKLGRSHKTISGQKQSALRKLAIRSDLELLMLQE